MCSFGIWIFDTHVDWRFPSIHEVDESMYFLIVVFLKKLPKYMIIHSHTILTIHPIGVMVSLHLS